MLLQTSRRWSFFCLEFNKLPMLSFAFQYGSVWRRLLALVIDLAVLAAIGVSLFDPVAMALGHDALKQASIRIPFSVMILRGYGVWAVTMLIIAWLYFSLAESSRKQATLGKRAMGLMVFTRTEARLSFGRASIRFWVKALSILTGFLGFFVAIPDSKSRMLHDRAAHSIVLQARKGSTAV